MWDLKLIQWCIVAFALVTLAEAAAFASGEESYHHLAARAPKTKKIAQAWYAGWHATGPKSVPLSKVPWDKYTHLTYAFAYVFFCSGPQTSRLIFELGSLPRP
jgi:GH18 family chitinase